MLFSADNRIALRDLDGVNRLIDFIGRPEFSDLHVYAVAVLSNCLEDFETMEVRPVSYNATLLVIERVIRLFNKIYQDCHPRNTSDGSRQGSY